MKYSTKTAKERLDLDRYTQASGYASLHDEAQAAAIDLMKEVSNFVKSNTKAESACKVLTHLHRPNALLFVGLRNLASTELMVLTIVGEKLVVGWQPDGSLEWPLDENWQTVKVKYNPTTEQFVGELIAPSIGDPSERREPLDIVLEVLLTFHR